MPPIATNSFDNSKSAGNNNFGNSEFSRYQQSTNANNPNSSNYDYDYLNSASSNSANNNNSSLNEFSKYRAPIIIENSYPSYGYNYNSDNNSEKNSFDIAHEGTNFTFDPNTNFNTQAAATAPVNLTSSWLRGNDFSMTAGELFGTRRNNKNNFENGAERGEREREKEFGNLGNFSGVNFDQIKIVRTRKLI